MTIPVRLWATVSCISRVRRFRSSVHCRFLNALLRLLREVLARDYRLPYSWQVRRSSCISRGERMLTFHGRGDVEDSDRRFSQAQSKKKALSLSLALFERALWGSRQQLLGRRGEDAIGNVGVRFAASRPTLLVCCGCP